jgi:DNA-binding HxlR family transcriptional regulator
MPARTQTTTRTGTDHVNGPECSIAATLEAVGDRWTLLILRDLFRGVRRFEALHRHLGIARNLLTDRLHRLAELGIVDRVPYQDRPVRHEYRLTAKGADLSPALVALMRWGDRWYAEDGPPTLLIHDACGTPLDQAVSCPECREPVAPHHIRSRPGPGRTTEEAP